MGGPSDPPYPQAGKPYGGFVPPQPSRFHTRAGFVCGVTMWLWVFYRAKQDLPALLGLEKPWEHGHHDSHDNDHDGAHA